VHHSRSYWGYREFAAKKPCRQVSLLLASSADKKKADTVGFSDKLLRNTA
jgi:hypothetical protein